MAKLFRLKGRLLNQLPVGENFHFDSLLEWSSVHEDYNSKFNDSLHQWENKPELSHQWQQTELYYIQESTVGGEIT